MGFRLYNVGAASSLLLHDLRVKRDVSVAFLTDLHLSPGEAAAGPRYREAVDWWNRFFDRPAGLVERLLDEITRVGVELVVWGGDNLDFFDTDTAAMLRNLCTERHLKAYFLPGNHDWESPDARFRAHDVDARERDSNMAALAEVWHMGPPIEVVEAAGIRLLLLHMRYRNDSGVHAVVEEPVAVRLHELLQDGVPTLIFYHYPFALPAVEHRLRAVWRGALPCAQFEDNDAVVRLIGNCPDVLATFCGHAHINSEDPFSEKGPWQFATGAGVDGVWRLVRVSADAAPKSLRVAGIPSVRDA